LLVDVCIEVSITVGTLLLKEIFFNLPSTPASKNRYFDQLDSIQSPVAFTIMTINKLPSPKYLE